MSFEAPVFLWCLLLVPALVAGYVWLQKRRAPHAIRFTNLEVLSGVTAEARSWRRHIPSVLFLLALSALLLGIARPQGVISVPREEATVVLTLDSSGSMEAEDVEPSRMEAAKDGAHSFLDLLPVDFQVGMVSFDDDTAVMAQPTTDRTAVRDAIDSLRPGGGTAMGDALAAALDVTRAEEPRRRAASPPSSPSPSGPSGPESGGGEQLAVILLLSDGYNTTGDVEPLAAAERARARGVPVFTIALGTPEGTVTTRDAFGRPRLLRVPPDLDTLRAISERTDGEFYEAPGEDDLARVYEDLGSRIGFVEQREETTFAFAAAGLLLGALGVGLAAAWGGRIP